MSSIAFDAELLRKGFPMIQQLCLHIPAATFADQCDGDQFPDIVDDGKNVQVEILKV
jgi:hypothetical protein